MGNYDVAQLKKLRVKIIEAARSGTFDMATWARQYQHCHTTYCAAGLVVVTNGWEICWPPEVEGHIPPYGIPAALCRNDVEGTDEIQTVASKILGLSYSEQMALFHACGPVLGESIEESEVIRVLDAVIKRAELGMKHAVGEDGDDTRQILLDWYATV